MTSENSSRVAALVDGDNVSPKHAERILRASRSIGQLDVAQVYGVMANSDWLTAPGWRFVHAGGGKNATDLLMSIEAMELAIVHRFETFVLATSDSDFTHVAQRLRLHGAKVFGVGEAKTRDQFRAACTDFFELPISTAASPPPLPEIAAPKTASKSMLDWALRDVIAELSSDRHGAPITHVNAAMLKRHGVRVSSMPEKTWRSYLSKRKELFEVEPKGPDSRVRFLRTAFPLSEKPAKILLTPSTS